MTADSLPPASKLREIMRLLAFDTDQRAHEIPGIELGGTVYLPVEAPEVHSALEHLREAAAIGRLAGGGGAR
jgi:hypothetical protein